MQKSEFQMLMFQKGTEKNKNYVKQFVKTCLPK